MWSCDYRIDDRRNRASRKLQMKKDSKREEAISSHIKKANLFHPIYILNVLFLRFSLHGSSYDLEMFHSIKNSRANIIPGTGTCLHQYPSHTMQEITIYPCLAFVEPHSSLPQVYSILIIIARD